MAEPTTSSAPSVSTTSTTGSALIVVGAIFGIALLVIVVFAFSTDRTGHSIDGRTATTSQYLE